MKELAEACEVVRRVECAIRGAGIGTVVEVEGVLGVEGIGEDAARRRTGTEGFCALVGVGVAAFEVSLSHESKKSASAGASFAVVLTDVRSVRSACMPSGNLQE